MLLNRERVVVAALAAAKGDAYTPVQLQKYIFLLDKNLPASLGAPFFDFQPYDYGAFDSNVYHEAQELARTGFVLINANPGTPVRTYAATGKGLEYGEQVLNELSPSSRTYMIELSTWVRSMSFAELVAAIYKLYPETKVNSVFQG